MTDEHAALIAAATYLAGSAVAGGEPFPGNDEAARDIRALARAILSEPIRAPGYAKGYEGANQ